MRLYFGEYKLDTDRELLTGPVGAVALRPQTYRLLLFLVQRAPALVTHDELMDVLWGHHALSPNVIPQAVSELRQALADDPQSPRYVETRHRRGYAFIATVEQSNELTGVSIEALPMPVVVQAAATETIVPDTREAPQSRRRWRSPWVWMALALVGIVLVFGGYRIRTTTALPRTAEVASPVDERLAVTLQIDDPNLRTYLVWFARYGKSVLVFDRHVAPASAWQISVSNAGQWSVHDPAGALRSSGDLAPADVPSQSAVLLQALEVATQRRDLSAAPVGWPTALEGRLALVAVARATEQARYREAGVAFAQLLTVDDVSGWPRVLLVAHQAALGRWIEAEKTLASLDPGTDRMLRLQQDWWRARFAGRPDEALAALRAAALLSPGDPDRQLALFDALVEQAQWQSAESVLDQLVIMLGEDAPEVSWRRAELVAVLAPAEAAVLFERAVASAEENGSDEAAQAALTQVRWMIQRGALKDAKPILDRLPEALPAAQMLRAEWAIAAGQLDLAKQSFAAAEVTWLSDDRLGGARRARLGLIDVALLAGDPASALTQAEALRNEVEASGDGDIEDKVWDAIGRAQIELSRFDDAKTSLLQAMTLARANGQLLREARSRYHLGNAFAQERKRPQEAEQAFRLAADTFHALGDSLWEVKALSNLALMAERSGRRLDARDAYHNALARARELDMPRERGRIAFNAGVNERDVGDLSAAAALIDEALIALSAAGALDIETMAAAVRADLALVQGDAERADAVLVATRVRAEHAAMLPKSAWHSAHARLLELAGEWDRSKTELDAVVDLRANLPIRAAQLDGQLRQWRFRLVEGQADRPMDMALERIEDELQRMSEPKYALFAALARVEWALVSPDRALARARIDAIRARVQKEGNRAQQLQLDWLAAHATEG
ncbi:MAG TPA: winged helix-turn-helix domain-containing protein, partial [Pseudomonadota bacterium]|nr:winged helix-turn-helix domain-containing protein [Pseudomonadota bacterium]